MFEAAHFLLFLKVFLCICHISLPSITFISFSIPLFGSLFPSFLHIGTYLYLFPLYHTISLFVSIYVSLYRPPLCTYVTYIFLSIHSLNILFTISFLPWSKSTHTLCLFVPPPHLSHTLPISFSLFTHWYILFILSLSLEHTSVVYIDSVSLYATSSTHTLALMYTDSLCLSLNRSLNLTHIKTH